MSRILRKYTLIFQRDLFLPSRILCSKLETILLHDRVQFVSVGKTKVEEVWNKDIRTI